jgi:hypothetical protein
MAGRGDEDLETFFHRFLNPDLPACGAEALVENL